VDAGEIVIRSIAFQLLPSILLLLGGVAVPAIAGPSADAVPAPKPLDLSAWRGKVVLVDFWASWCIPCRRSFPWMQSMLDAHGDEGLVVVAVNVGESREAADAFTKDRETDFVYVYDPEGGVADALGVEAMPSSILFDRQGRPVYRHSGFRPQDIAAYEEHIVALLEAAADGSPPPLEIGRSRRSGVRPWQRGALARESMRLDADMIPLAFDDHVYFSKEASSGGRSFGGGGCGCN
jgi:thiol-disulfide isomerase/thioredoxin